MAVAAEVSSAQLNPVTHAGIGSGFGGHIDANLLLADNASYTTAATTGIPVEPNKIAEFFFLATITGDRTATTNIQISRDGGSSYATYMTPRPIVIGDTGLPLAWVIWIPAPTGTNKYTYVRLNNTLGGTTGTITYTAGLRPLGHGRDRALANV
jgi:hypothetical protein